MTRIYKVRNDKSEEFDVDEDKLGEAGRDGFHPVVSNGTDEFTAELKDLPQAAKDNFMPVMSSDVGMLESGLRGAAQRATFGFADEIAGGAEALFTDKPYEEARDESRAAFSEAEQANPGSYLAGEVAGTIGTAFIPGVGALGTAAKGASLAKTAGAAALGAGIEGLGDSEAELGSAEMAGDVATSAALGGAGGAILSKGAQLLPKAGRAVGEFVDPYAQKLSKRLSGHAEEKAFEATGAKVGDLKRLLAQEGGDLARSGETQKRLGRTLLDKDLLTKKTEGGRASKIAAFLTGADADDIASGVKAEMKTIGGDIGGFVKILDRAEGTPSIRTSDVEDLLIERLKKMPTEELGYSAAMKNLTKEMELLEEIPTLTLGEAFSKRAYLDKQINWSALEDKPKNEVLKEYRRALNEAINSQLEAFPKGSGYDQAVLALKKFQKEYGDLATMKDTVNTAALRDQAKAPLSLTDYIFMTSGAAAGDLTGGAGALAAKKGLEKFAGPANRARFADWLSEKAGKAGDIDLKVPEAIQGKMPAIARSAAQQVSEIVGKPSSEYDLKEKEGYLKAVRYEQENPGDSKGLEKYLRILFPSIEAEETREAWLAQ